MIVKAVGGVETVVTDAELLVPHRRGHAELAGRQVEIYVETISSEVIFFLGTIKYFFVAFYFMVTIISRSCL